MMSDFALVPYGQLLREHGAVHPENSLFTFTQSEARAWHQYIVAFGLNGPRNLGSRTCRRRFRLCGER
jgi:hypothetical protein